MNGLVERRPQGRKLAGAESGVLRRIRSTKLGLAGACALVAIFGLVSFGPTSDAEAFLTRLYRGATRTVSRVGGALKRGATSAVRSVGRAASNVGRSVVRGARRVGRSIARGASRVGRSIARGASRVGRSIARGARRVGRSIARGARTAGKAIASGAKKVGRAVASGAKAVGGAVASGAKAVGKGVATAAKAVGNAVMSLGSAIKKYGSKALDKAKQLAKKYVLPLARQFMDQVINLMDTVYAVAKKVEPTIKLVEDAVKTANKIIDAILDPAKFIKNKAANALTDVAMKVLHPLLEKVNEALVGLALRLIKTPVAHAIATTVSTTIATAVAAVTAGVGAVLAPVLEPLLTWTTDNIIDWMIDQARGQIAKLVFGQTRKLLRKWLVMPLVQKSYKVLIGMIKKKFPEAWKKGKKALRNVQRPTRKVKKVVNAVDKGTKYYRKGMKYLKYGRKGVRVIRRGLGR